MTTRKEPRAVFFCHSAWSQRGGIQSFNRRVAEGLELAAVKHQTLILHDDATPSNSVRGLKSNYGAAVFWLLVEFIRSDTLLLGHINYLPAAVVFKVLKPFGRVILFAHGVEVWGSPKYRAPRRFEPRLLSTFVDRIAIVSEYSRKLMAASFSIPRTRFISFPNAVDCPKDHAAEAVNHETVLVVSRLALSEPEKNVDKVIEAFALVQREAPNARLIIVGDGGLRPKLEALSHVLGIASKVKFTGFVDDAMLSNLYSTSSVFALPSSKEGFGIVYLEAWLHGMPVVASIHGAGGEVVSDGKDGFVVDPDDLSCLARAITTLLVDQNKRRDFALNGKAKTIEKYSVRAFNTRLKNLLFDETEVDP